MATSETNYAEIEVDERLLLFEPYYRQLFLRQNPRLAKQADRKRTREALLRALEEYGHARRFQDPSGQIRLVPTDEYLRFLSDPE